MKFAFTIFACIICLDEMAVPYLFNTNDEGESFPSSPDDQLSDNKSLNLNPRNIDYTGSYAPSYPYYGSNTIPNWLFELSSRLSTLSNPIYPQAPQTVYPSQYWNYNDPHASQYSWNNGQISQDVGNNQHGTSWIPSQENYAPTVPKVTKKVSTIFSDDSKEIKHKVVFSPENPEGAGFISIRDPQSYNQPGGKVVYQF